jgi:hypothetical protein
MAWENKLALDIMLVEKGGVCITIGVPPTMELVLRPYRDQLPYPMS